MDRRTITHEDLHDQLRAQGVPREHVAFVCAACGTVQSLALFTRYDVPEEERERIIGYNCIGRYVGAGPYRAAHPAEPRLPALSLLHPGHGERPGCDWTLGGLLHIHALEVEMPNGKKRPTFAIASPELAQELQALIEPEAQPAQTSDGP